MVPEDTADPDGHVSYASPWRRSQGGRIARVDGRSHNSLCTAHILGSDRRREAEIPSELASDKALGAWASPSPGSGSDSLGMRTKAEWKKDRWVINGEDVHHPGERRRGVRRPAVTDREKGKDGVTAFVFPAGTKGALGREINFTSSDAFLGHRRAGPGRSRVRGPTPSVGKVHSGCRDSMKNLAGGRISIAALSVGSGLGAMREALA